jgi:hypothetical protein
MLLKNCHPGFQGLHLLNRILSFHILSFLNEMCRESAGRNLRMLVATGESPDVQSLYRNSKGAFR